MAREEGVSILSSPLKFPNGYVFQLSELGCSTEPNQEQCNKKQQKEKKNLKEGLFKQNSQGTR